MMTSRGSHLLVDGRDRVSTVSLSSAQLTSVAYFNLSGDHLYAASDTRLLSPREKQRLKAILEGKNG